MFFYLIWKKKKKKTDCNSLRYWFFAHIQTRNRVTHYAPADENGPFQDQQIIRKE